MNLVLCFRYRSTPSLFFVMAPRPSKRNSVKPTPSSTDMSQADPSLFKKLIQLFKTSKRPPPPLLGDGKYNKEAEHADLKQSIIKELTANKRTIPEDLDIVMEFINLAKAGGYGNLDPKQIPAMVWGLHKLLASLPPGGINQANLIAPLARLGWDSLGHPPVTYLGDEFQYRTADGSNNNIMYPHVGKSGTVYARSVKSTHFHAAVMPDPGTVFDALVARQQYKPHPNKISSLMFYLVVIIIHDLFRTSHDDPNISMTSSYLDLSPLYGSNQDEQNMMRTFKDGKIKPDCFNESRLSAFPPGVGVLLLCFNRFHNYVVEQLASINEGGKFTVPDKASVAQKVKVRATPGTSATDIDAAIEKAYADALKKQENDLFQVGRLVTCGLYINIVLNDYVGTLVGIPELNTAWFLDPYVGAGTEPLNGQATPIATGNQCSVEFNLVYRFHTIISDRDDKWTQNFMKDLFPGKDPETMSLEDFYGGLVALLAKVSPDPTQRDLHGMTRDPETGQFDDEQLVKMLTESTEDCAAAFDSGIPKVMRVIEILGINQSRYWKTATLNEFRKFFGLPPHKTFEDMNPDPEKVKALLHFYGHPDNVELYPGLIVEDVKSPNPGWLPPVTLSRAIFSDGLSLLRGDRFYTLDYSPTLLTQWGYNTVTSDAQVAGGSVMYKLLMKAFPGWYEFNSIYAMYPFSTPEKTKEMLTNIKTLANFSFAPPKKPGRPMGFVTTYDACIKILNDRENFQMAWGPGIKTLTGTDYMLSGDTKKYADQHARLHKEINGPSASGKLMWDFFEKTTNDLIKGTSFPIGKYYELDAVRDVGNITFVNFFAKLFAIPLKDTENPKGLITDQELFLILGAIFTYLFFNADESSGLKLQINTFDAYKQAAELLKVNVTKVKLAGGLDKAIDDIKDPKGFLHLYGDNLIRRMLKDGNSIDDIVAQALLTSTGVINISPQFAQMIDMYLSDEYAQDWNDIVTLANSEDTEATRNKLMRYVMEAMRITTSAAGVSRKVVNDIVVQDGENSVSLKAGDMLFADLDSANKQADIFPDPLKVNINRPDDKYIYFGWGQHSCVGSEMSHIGLTAMLRCFARLPKLRRSPGAQGTLKYVIMGPVRVYMQEDWSNYSPWPTTFKLQYDA